LEQEKQILGGGRKPNPNCGSGTTNDRYCKKGISLLVDVKKKKNAQRFVGGTMRGGKNKTPSGHVFGNRTSKKAKERKLDGNRATAPPSLSMRNQGANISNKQTPITKSTVYTRRGRSSKKKTRPERVGCWVGLGATGFILENQNSSSGQAGGVGSSRTTKKQDRRVS